jgi:hypothetical protein
MPLLIAFFAGAAQEEEPVAGVGDLDLAVAGRKEGESRVDQGRRLMLGGDEAPGRTRVKEVVALTSIGHIPN